MMEPHARTGECSSHLPVLRGVSIAKGAGDHQDQSFVFQVHDVIFFHGHHLGGQGQRHRVGEKKEEGDEDRGGGETHSDGGTGEGGKEKGDSF